MPHNLFRSAAPDLSLGMEAFDASAARQKDFRQDRARITAGRSLATGDRAGAATALGGAGMVDDVRQLQSDQRGIDDTAYQHSQDAQRRTDDQAAQRGKALVAISQGLKRVPVGQRLAALQKALPVFQGLGIDASQFANLTEQQLDDGSLDMFSGEVSKQIGVNLGGGGYGTYDPYTGTLKTLREPDPKLVSMGNGAALYDPDAGEVVARNPKTFAPPRPRAGGGSDNGAALQALEAELRRRGKL